MAVLALVVIAFAEHRLGQVSAGAGGDVIADIGTDEWARPANQLTNAR
ncbi:hypothetical protein [Brevibacterium sp. 239c]|nr:hypothetical protein [Brevibacterium sp. 239c]